MFYFDHKKYITQRYLIIKEISGTLINNRSFTEGNIVVNE